MAQHRVIGMKDKMPWHLPAELAYFKKITLGKPVLMGRRTFVSIGRPLPARRNLILTHQANLHIPGCEIFRSLEEVFATVASDEELMVIGGATLFSQTLPLAQRMYLTFIDCQVDGDTYFPEWNPDQWRETHSQFFAADAANPYSFRAVKLERIDDTLKRR